MLTAYLLNKGLDKVPAPEEVKTAVKFLANPKGFVANRLAQKLETKIIDAAHKRALRTEDSKAQDTDTYNADTDTVAYKKGGRVYSKGGKVRKIDGCAQRGKTRGKFV
jgi:hypothetical protein